MLKLKSVLCQQIKRRLANRMQRRASASDKRILAAFTVRNLWL